MHLRDLWAKAKQQREEKHRRQGCFPKMPGEIPMATAVRQGRPMRKEPREQVQAEKPADHLNRSAGLHAPASFPALGATWDSSRSRNVEQGQTLLKCIFT